MLTCFSYKYFLWCADGSFPDSIVHAQSDLIAFVFTQICTNKYMQKHTFSIAEDTF